MTKSTAIKCHGGKAYLADWIISHFPPRCKTPNAPAADDPGWLHYVEPYFGGGSVLQSLDPTGISEVANDLKGTLANFWQVMADDGDFEEFRRIVECTPFCECEWARAAFEWWKGESRADTAARYFIRCRQSMSGRMKSFAPLTRNRTRQGMNEQASAWWSAVECLPEIHARLKRVVILNRPAVEVIKQQDGPRTLLYLDPPYLHSTRSTTTEYGEHEMSDDDHEELLKLLGTIKGRFVLSGYPSPLYEKHRKKFRWRTDTKIVPNQSSKASKKEPKPETLWMNF